jgi:alkylhydroperoxidase family enzyme
MSDPQADDIARRQEKILGKPPRVAPLDRQEHAAEIVRLTTALRNDVAGADLPPIPLEYCPDLVPTMMKHKELWDRMSALSALVQSTRATLPPRERQLAIMRAMWLAGAPYQWGEHYERTKALGFSDADMARIKDGSSAPGWTPSERAVLQAVEELRDDAFISDETWAALREHFDEPQMLELIILVGQFISVAFLLNSLRLRLEPNNKGLLST